jgi:Tfp pilus assembly protein PilV
MQSFVIRPMTWPVLRIFSRNPLIRTSDRIETLVGTLAVVLVVIATACAGVLGTIIHDNRARQYLQQAQTRHAVVATAVTDGEPAVSPETMAFTVNAQWRFNGVDHTDLLGWTDAVKAGEPLHIWVDDLGNRVEKPSPVERAAVDALSAAVVGWLIVIAATAQVVVVVRAHASRMRDAQWERDIRFLVDEDVDEDGGRTNRSQ